MSDYEPTITITCPVVRPRIPCACRDCPVAPAWIAVDEITEMSTYACPAHLGTVLKKDRAYVVGHLARIDAQLDAAGCHAPGWSKKLSGVSP